MVIVLAHIVGVTEALDLPQVLSVISLGTAQKRNERNLEQVYGSFEIENFHGSSVNSLH